MQDLLQSANPERKYDFMDRNFIEEFDLPTFRQILADNLVLDPDVATCHFDKEDKESSEKKNCLAQIGKKDSPSLLLSLNFKNPPGRLLRRQWTQPLVGIPDYHHWRLFKDQIQPPTKCLNIDLHKLSLIRQNSKYCYPCDNSVIRI